MSNTTRRIPEDFIQSLLTRVDIVDVIGNYVQLRKAGANYVACCPFHNEKTPSFSVNRNKQFYHCFGCGVSGDVIQFLIEHKALSFVEAVEILAGQVGMVMPNIETTEQSSTHNLIYNILLEATVFFEQQLRQQTLAKQAVQYLKDRGITGITAKNFRLGFAPHGWNNLLTSIAKDAKQKDLGVQAGLFIQREPDKLYDRFRNRIIFPIRNRRGKVIGFGGRIIGNTSDEPKYLNSPETPVFNKSHELYGCYEGRQAIAQANSVIVVEGYMDVVSLAQAGIQNVVATLGTACTEHHVKYLFKLVPEVVFCFDGDVAGKKAAWRALELCLPLLDDKHRVKFLILGNNEDPDSYVRKYGADALQNEIKQAQSLPDFMFLTLAKRVDLEQTDGKVQFANQVRDYLLKLPDGILKAVLFERLAQMIDIDPAKLRSNAAQPQRWSEFNKTILNKSKTQINTKATALVSPALRAAALLLNYRELIDHLPVLSGLEEVDIYGCALLCALGKLLLVSPQATDDEIRAQLAANLAAQFNPAELRGIARIVPVAGVREEFLGAISVLRRREKELMTDKLLLKAKQNALSPSDKQLLQQLLLDKES